MSEVLRKSGVIPRNTQSIAREVGEIVRVPDIADPLTEALLGYTKNPNIVAAGIGIFKDTHRARFHFIELTSFMSFGAEEMFCMEQTDINNPLYKYRKNADDGEPILGVRPNIITTNSWLPRNWGYRVSQDRYFNDPEYQIKYLRKMFYRYRNDADDFNNVEQLAQFFARIRH